MLILTQYRCTVCVECSIGSEIILWVMWDLTSFSLETVLVSVQDRCMVCAKRTIGSEIILDTPDGTPSDMAQVEACFSSFGGRVNIDAI